DRLPAWNIPVTPLWHGKTCSTPSALNTPLSRRRERLANRLALLSPPAAGVGCRAPAEAPPRARLGCVHEKQQPKHAKPKHGCGATTIGEGLMFTQLLDPLNNLTLTCLVALIPVVLLLVLLALFRWPAWLAVLVGSIVTFVLAAWVWKMPFDNGWRAYWYG